MLFGSVALAAGGIAVAVSRQRARHPATPPQLREALPVEVRMFSVAPATLPAARPDPAVVSAAVSSVCGLNPSTANRYEARSEALRSIGRERELPANDVAALVAWLASTDDPLRAERLAALKNDVMNLLRNQKHPPPDFADTLVAMFNGGAHSPAILDYCVQHLGAMLGGAADDDTRRRIRAVVAKAAGRARQSYAGTALYSLAEDASATPGQEAELRRLTLALCAPDADAAARIAAIQLAGERGYAEALPLIREELSSPRRDAVTDIARIGSLGLLGDSADLPLLRRLAAMGPRLAPAAEAAIRRIEGRTGSAGDNFDNR